MAGGKASSNTICSAKSPSSAAASCENVPRPERDLQLGAELLAGPDDLHRLLLAEAER